jgi:thiopurine S-methyltransferase
MEPDFWHERWAANQIGFHQCETNTYLENYWQSAGLDRGSRILVPLCGKSLDMLWLARQGYRVAGIEISTLAVEAFFSENDLQPVTTDGPGYTCWSDAGIDLYCADFFNLHNGDIGNIDGLFDRAALIAMAPSQRIAYVAHLTSLLPAQASGLLVTLDYNQQEMGGPPFPVSPDEVESLLAADFSIEPLHTADILEGNPAFRDRGLGRLMEHVYRLVRT